MAAHNDFGARAEAAAAALMERNGWTILARNWRFGHREIDLIARRGRTIAFVEVKARSALAHGHPLENIGWRKRHHLAAAAAAWIRTEGRPGWEYRYDAVDVVRVPGRNPPLRVTHTADAWSM